MNDFLTDVNLYVRIHDFSEAAAVQVLRDRTQGGAKMAVERSIENFQKLANGQLPSLDYVEADLQRAYAHLENNRKIDRWLEDLTTDSEVGTRAFIESVKDLAETGTPPSEPELRDSFEASRDTSTDEVEERILTQDTKTKNKIQQTVLYLMGSMAKQHEEEVEEQLEAEEKGSEDKEVERVQAVKTRAMRRRENKQRSEGHTHVKLVPEGKSKELLSRRPTPFPEKPWPGMSTRLRSKGEVIPSNTRTDGTRRWTMKGRMFGRTSMGRGTSFFSGNKWPQQKPHIMGGVLRKPTGGPWRQAKSLEIDKRCFTCGKKGHIQSSGLCTRIIPQYLPQRPKQSGLINHYIGTQPQRTSTSTETSNGMITPRMIGQKKGQAKLMIRKHKAVKVQPKKIKKSPKTSRKKKKNKH